MRAWDDGEHRAWGAGRMHTHAHQGTPCMVCRTRTCTLTSELHEECAAVLVSLTPRCLHPSRPSRRDEISRSNVNDPHYANTACHRYAAKRILSLCPMYTADSPRNRQPASRDTLPTQSYRYRTSTFGATSHGARPRCCRRIVDARPKP